ncbi:MAG: OmpA family protein [Acidobacteria bacterium]|nr:OmpA family protein [Acidobacteriota bacterium]
MSLDPGTATRTVTQRVRRYRRATGDGLPFIPYGLLPLAGLVLLTFIAWTSFAQHSIERVVRETAELAITDTGADWARVHVSGQWVTVLGTPETPEAGERLINAIRTARAPTWLGLARPVTRVRGDFGGTSFGPNFASSAVPALSGDKQQPEFLFRLSGARMTLDGRVPDIATRDAIVAAANASRPVRIQEVKSNLETLGTPAPEGFREAALRGVEALKFCDTGTASFTALHFDLRCELPESEAEQVRTLASAPLAYGSVGEIQILPTEVVESCEQELTRLLEASRIEFAPGSDTIASSKAALLDLTARAAADCPGTLRVEGHTDNTGSAAINENLSLRRAEAVRAALIQRGVAPARLIAAGYGPARPIGDNATEEGRALNRRIEIRIVRPDE